MFAASPTTDSSTLEIRVYDKRKIGGTYRFVGGVKEGVEMLHSRQDEQGDWVPLMICDYSELKSCPPRNDSKS
jgi:hypothetical protein